VLAKIAVDDKFAVNCLLQLYYCQTADERATEATRHTNGIGFNAVDAGILSSFAEQVLKWKADGENESLRAARYPSPLSVKQLALLRGKLARYQRQLTELVNAALLEKEIAALPAGQLDAIGQAADEVEYQQGQTQQEHEAAVHARAAEILAQQEAEQRETEDRFGEERDELDLSTLNVPICPIHGPGCADPEGGVRAAGGHPWLPGRAGEIADEIRERNIDPNGHDPRSTVSTRLVKEGTVLRFPTAKELSEGGRDRGIRPLQETLSAARWTRPLDEGEDLFGE